MIKHQMWIFAFLAIAIVVSGCSTQVRVVEETKIHRPNVQPTESTFKAPEPEPYQPTQPTTPNVQPVEPVYNPTTPSTPEYTPVQPVEPIAPIQPAPSQPDWINETLTVTGQCAMDSNQPAGQAKLMAKRGATVDALRNLLESVLGLRIDSKTVVKDMVTESDRIISESSGIIKGFQVLDPPAYSADGICTVRVSLNLSNVWQHVRK